MVLAGFGMVVGNLLGGKLSDKYTPGRVAASTQFILFTALLGIFFVAHINWLTALLMCLCTAGLFAVSSPQQISIIHFAKGGELLGAACIQVAFNLGNAIGAYIGGLPLQAGLGYQYPALIGAPLAFVGFILLTLFYKNTSRRRCDTKTAEYAKYSRSCFQFIPRQIETYVEADWSPRYAVNSGLLTKIKGFKMRDRGMQYGRNIPACNNNIISQ